jgi:lipoprotein-anchoring transpeptidase ErfK/SrfK
MGRAVRRWLLGLGVLVAGGALLGQAGVASASPAARAGGAARAAVSAYVPPGRILSLGMHGPAVRSLQQRLAALKYYPGRIDGQFGLDTLEAVWAFKEVQGFPINFANQDVVSIPVERRLVHPRAPRVLVPHGGSMRVEVNMANETLVLYNRGKVELISHVSTGAGCLPGQGCRWVTPTGSYRALGYSNGWIQVPLGQMYNSVWFIGTVFAIHGEFDSSVPFYPDSHGCVRIPFDIANFFHTLIRIPGQHFQGRGTPIYIENPGHARTAATKVVSSPA